MRASGSPRSALTIDVDSLHYYFQIHGLRPPEIDRDPIYTVALDRWGEILADADVLATLFLIGEDARHHPAAFAPFVDRGCELASHSHAHDYRLSRRPPSEIVDDLRRADEVIRGLSGRPVVGFRAPGYNVTPPLLEAVVGLGYRYDASLLPAPLYWGLRASVIGAYRALRRPSASLVGDVRQFWGPRTPYRMRPDRPWRPAPGPLWELPISTGVGRFPLIGTTWVALPGPARRALLPRLDQGYFHFELHAIDLLDRSDPLPAALGESQRDLQIPVRRKLRALRELTRHLREHSDVVTLAGLAPPIL